MDLNYLREIIVYDWQMVYCLVNFMTEDLCGGTFIYDIIILLIEITIIWRTIDN